MCHGAAIDAFPAPAGGESFASQVQGFRFATPRGKRVAILPDIYGCNDFYRGLAVLLQQNGADVWLVDTFAGLGELPENTREAAFARRDRVRDKTFLDRFEAFAGAEKIGAVIGFCLGGLYVFELARRGLDADLLGLYGFPQGLPNEDPLPVPLDYLPQVKKPFTMLMGRSDESVGADNIARLEAIAQDAPAMDLTIYDGVGHNFLPFLDSDDPRKHAVAVDARDRILRVAAS